MVIRQKNGPEPTLSSLPLPKGAIFDLDGTLLDSMEVWADIDRRFLQKRGIEVPKDYLRIITPMGFAGAADYTIERFGLKENPQDIMAEWDQMAEELYRKEVRLKPGAEELLQYFHRHGVKLALATAAMPNLFEPALQNNGVYDLFDAFAFVREVPRQKGYPDVYLLAAERLGLTASDCMVFEDIAAGIRGAKMGGFFACGVYEPASAHEAEQIRSAADLYLQSFGQLLDLFQGTLE